MSEYMGFRKERLINCLARAAESAGVLDWIVSARSNANKNSVSILTYHRVNHAECCDLHNRQLVSASPEMFKKQMLYLKRHYQILTFKELKGLCSGKLRLKPNKRGFVLITFDDGYRDNYAHAYPVLKGHGISAAFFVTTGFVDGRSWPWWDVVIQAVINTKKHQIQFKGHKKISLKDKKKAVGTILKSLKKMKEGQKQKFIRGLLESCSAGYKRPERLFLTPKEIKVMSSNGMEFGAHTVTHPIISKVAKSDAYSEISGSIGRLEQITGKKTRLFAIPNGEDSDMGRDFDSFLKKHGIWFCLSSVYGSNRLGSKAFRLRRIGIGHNDSMALYKLKLSGLFQSWIRLFWRWLG